MGGDGANGVVVVVVVVVPVVGVVLVVIGVVVGIVIRSSAQAFFRRVAIVIDPAGNLIRRQVFLAPCQTIVGNARDGAIFLDDGA